MNKKHFIILGPSGLIYYSWMLIILFLSLIITFEGTKAVNWPAIACGLLFVLVVFYTYFNSYWHDDVLKLPFRAKIRSSKKPQLVYKWHWIKVYAVKVTELGQYYLFRLEK